MRRGSVITYADDGRRRSAGMVSTELHRNSTASNTNSTRHEFQLNEIEYEQTGGCFVSYRKVAFAFVFFLAVVIAAAFIGVYVGAPVDKEPLNVLDIFSKEDEIPEKFALAHSIKPLRYQIELQPILEDSAQGAVRFKGRVVIEFVQNGTSGPSQLVLNSKHLSVEHCRLASLDNVTDLESDDDMGPRRNKRDADDIMNETTTESFISESSTESSIVSMHPKSEANSTEHASHTVEEPSSRNILRITGNKTDEADGDYIIFLEKPLRNGSYSLEIEYHTTVDRRTMFAKNVTKNSENRLLLVSQLKPVSAPRLFPTLDEAKLKASFVLTISHPRDTKVLSNTPAANFSDSSESLTTTTFMETNIMSAHNLAFVVGHVQSLGEVSTEHNSSIVYWSDGEHQSQEFYLHGKLASIASTFEGTFVDIPRPTDKLDITALPIDIDGLSAPGLITMRESLFYTAANAPVITKTKALLSLIGLVGQQWLGGLVDAKNWTDAWYLEGSNIYFQYSLIDKIDHSLEASDNFLVDVLLESLEIDGYVVSKALDAKVNRTRIEALDLPENYNKGACLISMLHAALNESAFRTGYTNFLRHWRYRSADSDVFLHDLIGHSTVDGNTSLSEALKGWTREAGYPLVTFEWDQENGTAKVTQTKFNFEEPSEELVEEPSTESLWWVPVTYVTSEGDWANPTTVWLKGKKEMTLLNVGKGSNASWVVVNVNKTGFYRVNYNETNWRALCASLRESHADFPAATRAALIDDALSLARQGSLSYDVALDFLLYFGASERSYLPWKALERHILQLNFALYETAAYPSFQDYVKDLVGPLFDDMEPKIDQGTPLVMLAVKLACLFEQPKCMNWAKSKWEGLFRNNVENMLLKHVRETVYCVGALRGGTEELNYLMQKFSETNDRDEKDRLLSALGCFQPPWILQKILDEMLDTDKYDEYDIRVVLRSYAKNPAAAQVARRFGQERWGKIIQRYSHSYWTMKSFVEASTSLLFTEIDYNEFNEFRDKHIESLLPMGHWVALNEMKASSWISRLKSSVDSIQKWFKNHTVPAT